MHIQPIRRIVFFRSHIYYVAKKHGWPLMSVRGSGWPISAIALSHLILQIQLQFKTSSFGKYGKNFGRSRTYYDTQRKKKPTHFFGWQHNKEATFCEASLEYQFSRFLPTFSDTCVLSYVAMTYWKWVDNHTFKAVFVYMLKFKSSRNGTEQIFSQGLQSICLFKSKFHLSCAILLTLMDTWFAKDNHLIKITLCLETM